MPYLSCRQMHEDVERLHALFYCPDGVKGWRDDILHHHLQVLDTSAESKILTLFLL